MQLHLATILFRRSHDFLQSKCPLRERNKVCLQDTTFTSYSDFNKDNFLPFNLSKNEFESLCKLKNENNLIIQRAGKGNTIVILDKDSYLKSIETF